MVSSDRALFRAATLSLPLIFLGSQSALSQDAKSSDNQWIITLGGSVEYGPSYEGSKHLSFSGMPSFDFRRFGEAPEYSAPDDNIDYGLFDIGGIEIGSVVGLRGGRSAFNESELQGLHSVQWNLDAGVFAQYWPIEDRLRVRAETRQALWGGDGLLADLYLDWFQPVGDRWLLSAGPRMSLANGAYMRNNFAVSAEEAANSGRVEAFDANGGLKSIGFMVAATYTLSPAWSVQIYDKYSRLVGDAADSPVTSGLGSADQNVIGITLNRSFQIGF
jgi:outer membrane scaffolding protein for murein synthesis (MipA/OmpV family)